MDSVTIWIKLPGLDFKYWSPIGLSKVGSLIGKPSLADQNTEKKQGLNFARIPIEVELGVNLPKKSVFQECESTGDRTTSRV